MSENTTQRLLITELVASCAATFCTEDEGIVIQFNKHGLEQHMGGDFVSYLRDLVKEEEPIYIQNVTLAKHWRSGYYLVTTLTETEALITYDFMRLPNSDYKPYKEGEENAPKDMDTDLHTTNKKILQEFAAATKEDPVNHPRHYTAHPSGVECIEITRHMNFNLGNAMKYLWRASLKGKPCQDLEKAIWYIKDEIKRLESENG